MFPFSYSLQVSKSQFTRSWRDWRKFWHGFDICPTPIKQRVETSAINLIMITNRQGCNHCQVDVRQIKDLLIKCQVAPRQKGSILVNLPSPTTAGPTFCRHIPRIYPIKEENVCVVDTWWTNRAGTQDPNFGVYNSPKVTEGFECESCTCPPWFGSRWWRWPRELLQFSS